MTDYVKTERGDSVGKRLKAQPDRTCIICGAKLSKYRNAREKQCAFHGYVDPIIVTLDRMRIRMATKATKQLVSDLEKLDYENVGFDRNGHYMMEHAWAGRISVSNHLNDSSEMPKQLLTKAKRQVAQVNQDIGSLIAYLRKKYNVPESESVTVQTSLQKELRAWGGVHHKTPKSHMARALTDGGYVRMVKQGQGKTPSVIEIYGHKFVPTDEEPTPDIDAQGISTEVEAPICGAQHPRFPAVWCTLAPDHEDVHRSEAVDEGWWTQEDPVEEPEPVAVATPEPEPETPRQPYGPGEPVYDVSHMPEQPVTLPGMVSIPADAAAQIAALLNPRASTDAENLRELRARIQRLRKAHDEVENELYAIERKLGLS